MIFKASQVSYWARHKKPFSHSIYKDFLPTYITKFIGVHPLHPEFIDEMTKHFKNQDHSFTTNRLEFKFHIHSKLCRITIVNIKLIRRYNSTLQEHHFIVSRPFDKFTLCYLSTKVYLSFDKLMVFSVSIVLN